MSSRMTLDELRQRWTGALVLRGPCIRCGSGRVWHNGVRRRQACLQVGERVEFVADVPVRRLRCGDCKQRWSRAPEGVTERGTSQPCVMASAVSRDSLAPEVTSAQVAREHQCHPRTLWRWVARVALVSGAVLAQLLVAESGTPVLPRPPAVRPRDSARREELAAKAVEVLSLLDALASHRGLPPPGLCYLGDFVPGDAGRGLERGGAPSAG